jgi:hypothetical protein
MSVLRKIFPRIYERTPNFTRFCNIMSAITRYEGQVDHLPDSLNLGTYTKFKITEPSYIESSIDILGFNIRNDSVVDRKLNVDTRTSHYTILIDYARERVRKTEQKMNSIRCIMPQGVKVA